MANRPEAKLVLQPPSTQESLGTQTLHLGGLILPKSGKERGAHHKGYNTISAKEKNTAAVPLRRVEPSKPRLAGGFIRDVHPCAYRR